MAKALEADRQLYEVALLWTYDHHRMCISERFDGWETLYHCWLGMNTPQELASWWSVFRALHDQDLDFAIVSPGNVQGEKLLVYAGPGEVRVEDWRKVTELVDEGATLHAFSLPAKDIDGRTEEISGFNDRLRASGRLVVSDGGTPGDFVAQTADDTPVRSNTAGVWTTAYETDDAVWLFVINTTEAPARPEVALGAELARAWRDAIATDIVTGETVVVAAGGIRTIDLGPKRVRAFMVPKAAG